MWIKPIGKTIISKPDELGRKRFELLIGKKSNASFNIDFLSLYESDVFTNIKDLKLINKNIDVVIFTGYAGCGHYAPARALALEYEKRGLNVILIDPLFMMSRTTAIINCNSWKFVSRYCQSLWSLTRKIASNQYGSDILFKSFIKILSDDLKKFLANIKPKIILSTYTYTDAIMSQFKEYSKCLAVVVPDLNPIGFMNEIYHDTQNIHYFISSKEAYELGIKLYPYAFKNAGAYIMGNTPNFLSSDIIPQNLGYKKDILLFIPGSGLGIGKGFDALEDILNAWNGYTIIVCGDNQRWLNKANKIARHCNKLIPFGYVNYYVLEYLMEHSQIIIGKSGGSMSVELASIRGCKIIYAPIVGQEVENAEYYSALGCLTYAKNKKQLIEFIRTRPYTKSLYELKDSELNKISTTFVVDKTIDILKEQDD